jgi:site-specific DNA-methyltransferase (adenine-specific)
MIEGTGFSLKQRNPDVLTSIANLSNDEVFTPPAFANQMLDTIEEAWATSNNGASIWEDSAVTFLDPFTKSGVFLREITRRLSKGLRKHIPDDQARVDHILTKQVFGVAITELTALLARRSLYCSKYANGKHSICSEFDTHEGNIWFERTEHTWVGGKEKIITVDDSGLEVEKTTDGTCKFCGAKQKEYERGTEAESHAYSLIHTEDPKSWVESTFGGEMQFDVIVGNPPYQLSDGGYGSSAAPIYQKFVAQAKSLEPRYLSMVIPARWFGGGKGLDSFRKEMLEDRQVTALSDFPDASDAFAGVDISGGVCFFLWEKGAESDCEVSTWVKGDLVARINRPLKVAGMEIFVRYAPAISIIRKVAKVADTTKNSGADCSALHVGYMASLVSSRKPFGLSTSVKGHAVEKPGDLVLYKFGDPSFISDADVTNGHEMVDKFKVITSYVAYDHGGNPGKDGRRKVFSKIQIAPPGSVCTETYLVVGAFDSRSQAENLVSYMKTRFFRFLVSLTMFSHHITRSGYVFVPIQDFARPWRDEDLYSKYKLTQHEIDFIESMIRPMELEDA